MAAILIKTEEKVVDKKCNMETKSTVKVQNENKAKVMYLDS